MRSRHVRLQAAAAGLAVAILVLGGCKQGEKAGEAEKTAAQEMAAPKPAAAMPEVERGYAPVNGLKMYYEIHGTGRPLVLIHGAFMTVDAWGDVLPGTHHFGVSFRGAWLAPMIRGFLEGTPLQPPM